MTDNETKTCPDCQSKISAKAKKCPHCRKDLRSWFARHPILTIIGVLILLPTITGLFTNPNRSETTNSNSETSGQANKTPTPVRRDDFIAGVNYDGAQFTISNLDNMDCIDARIELNGGWFKNGYELEGYTLETGKTYTVGAMRFANKNGEKFNPFTHQPLDIFIECQGENELQYASYLAEFR